MSFKRLLKKMANYILASESKEVVNVKIGQINYGEILKGQNIIVTGGGRGIGYYIAKRCIDEGARVIISGRNEETLKKSTKELGEKCLYVKYDISDVENADNFLIECEKMFGGGAA